MIVAALKSAEMDGCSRNGWDQEMQRPLVKCLHPISTAHPGEETSLIFLSISCLLQVSVRGQRGSEGESMAGQRGSQWVVGIPSSLSLLHRSLSSGRFARVASSLGHGRSLLPGGGLGVQHAERGFSEGVSGLVDHVGSIQMDSGMGNLGSRGKRVASSGLLAGSSH